LKRSPEAPPALAGFGASQLGAFAPNANYIGWQGSGDAAEASAELGLRRIGAKPAE